MKDVNCWLETLQSVVPRFLIRTKSEGDNGTLYCSPTRESLSTLLAMVEEKEVWPEVLLMGVTTFADLRCNATLERYLDIESQETLCRRGLRGRLWGTWIFVSTEVPDGKIYAIGNIESPVPVSMCLSAIAVKDQVVSRGIDLNSPVFKTLLTFLLETIREAMEASGERPEMIEATFSRLRKALGDGWEAEAKNRMRNVV